MRTTTEMQFAVRQSGSSIGLEIVSPRGKIVARTVDPDVAQVIASHLNEIIKLSPEADEGNE